MRYISTPMFSEKVQSLTPARQAQLSALLGRVEEGSKADILTSGVASLLQDDMYLLRSGDTRVFGTIGEDAEGEFLLLLDLAERSSSHLLPRQFRTSRNPRTNSTLNPRANTALNPRVNSALNPRVNSSLNPRVNTSLNPRVNSSLNPRVNSALNYRVNSSINPRVNASLNPRVNSALNPRVNRAFGGPFVYDLDLNETGFVVRANADVMLIFDKSSELAAIAIRSAKGYALFDTDNEWVGQLIDAGEGRYLRFDVDNEWTGFVT